MSEIITLTTPITKPNQTTVKLDRVTFDLTGQTVLVQWLGNNNEAASAVYPTPAILNPLGVLQPTGAALLTAVNTANLTANSLLHRIMTRVITDGYVIGTVSGSPD